MFCALGTFFFFFNFSVFPRTLVTIHFLPRLNLSQTHHVSLEKSPFFHHFNLNLQEKGMGFLTLTKYFTFLTLDLLICEFLLSIVLHGVSDMGWVIFVKFD